MDTIYRLYELVGDGTSKDIFDACLNNDCCYVIKYFEEGNDMNVIDEKKESLLHKASRNNNYEIVDLLIRLKANINSRNKYNETPLHLAVQFKNSDVADKLIFEGAKVNAQDNKKISPLHLAASRGRTEIINLIINHGGKINISDENGAKPIHFAVKSGKKEVISCLLNNGASLSECDSRNDTVLHYACKRGDDELVIYILRHLTVNNSKNIFGNTALHLAAEFCRVSTIKLLIENGYSLEIKNNDGLTPIDIAKKNGKNDNYDFLVAYQKTLSYKEKCLDYTLHRSALLGNYNYLLQKIDNSNVNNIDYYGKSIMYYAILNGSLKTVQLLLRYGASIENIDEHKQSALLIAIYSDNIPIIEFLIKQKANVNEIFYGRSYLYRCILKNNYEMTKTLIDAGANVNYIDYRHRTIFSYAIDYADDEILDMLVAKKAGLV